MTPNTATLSTPTRSHFWLFNGARWHKWSDGPPLSQWQRRQHPHGLFSSHVCIVSQNTSFPPLDPHMTHYDYQPFEKSENSTLKDSHWWGEVCLPHAEESKQASSLVTPTTLDPHHPRSVAAWWHAAMWIKDSHSSRIYLSLTGLTQLPRLRAIMSEHVWMRRTTPISKAVSCGWG